MRVGIIGLGAMGAAIARRLEQNEEHELVVWNRSAGRAEEFSRRGIAVADSPADLLSRVDACVSSLPDGAAVEQVAEQLCAVEATDPPRTWIEMSTIDVAASERIAARAEAAGLDYLRAPVSGNPTVVAAGNLTIVSSGPEAALERVRPLLGAIGPNLFHVGPAEHARVMKLALNLMISATNQMLAEALALGEANGLRRAQMLEIISASAVGSPFVKYKAGPLAEDDYTSTFSAALMAKDLDLILACAADGGVPVPATEAGRQVIQDCLDAGLGELDLSVVLPLLRRQAGLADALPDPPG
ncbi:MAG: NAD(P)-dependent oxidoreductase [Solirubrobacterales bacterium]